MACRDFRGAGLIETLEQLGRQLEAAVLIPTMDHTVLLASEHRARLEPYYRHFLPPDTVIQQLMNKASIYDYAVAHGFQMPQTWVVQCQADLERCLEQLALPCILKPQVKTRGFLEHRTAKAFLLHEADAVRRTYAHLAQGEPRVVVQQWIPGPDTNLIFCLYYFDERGEPLASFTGRKIRQFIPYCGTAASAEPWEDAWVREAGIRFFQAAGYRGLAAIEFKIDQRDGAYHLMEPTVGRTEHLCALAAANGVNLPLAAWCDLSGQPLPPVERVRRPVRYVDRQRDRRAYRHYRAAGELTWRQWRQSLRGPKQRALAAWDDPGPLLHAVVAPALRKGRRLYQLTVGRLLPNPVPSPASWTSSECDEN
ncbi:MAG: hypothetical protein J5I93_29245 [Pirellulaceae bacterium]|nr:hypothetical protein [Pirellulaceae bacterium]